MKAHFIESGRNNLVRDHYSKLGLNLLKDGETENEWLFDVADSPVDEAFLKELPFKIV